MNNFKQQNPDFPISVQTLKIEWCEISDTDIPSGNGGINGERYTYGELRHHPVIPELIRGISNSALLRYAQECNNRNSHEGFTMYKVQDEWCFWGLRIGPVVKTPTLEELRQLLPHRPVTAEQIRAITYQRLRNEVALRCNLSEREASLAIGNTLDCAPHEDKATGYIYMVPNWAHKWFRHDGYVSCMMKQLNF